MRRVARLVIFSRSCPIALENAARSVWSLLSANMSGPGVTRCTRTGRSRIASTNSGPFTSRISWSANAFGAYSRPLKLLKSILTFHGGGSFNQTPTRINSSSC